MAAVAAMLVLGVGGARSQSLPPALPLTPAYANLSLIQSPQNRWFVTGPKVRLRVHSTSSVTTFQAFMDSRQITGRFGPPVGGVRTATIRLGRGVHYLKVFVTGGGEQDFDTSRFVVASRRPSYLALSDHYDNSQLSVSVRASARIDSFRVLLNGRYVQGSFTGGRVRSARLDADDGLRFGRNRLTVVAVNDAGFYDRETSAINVPRDHPLVAAGASQQIMAGDEVRLDASATRPAHQGDRLRYLWRVVSKPPGSHPRLIGPRTVSPLLVVDKPGRYQVKLTVRERGVSASSTTTSGPMSDQALVLATPDIPPIGLPIETIPATKNGIQLGNNYYPATSQGRLKGWVQMLVLDRKTLQRVPSRRIKLPANPWTFNLADGGNLLNAIAATSKFTQLVVLTGGQRRVPLDSSQVNTLVSALKQLGGTDMTLPGGRDRGFSNGSWSVIGSRGFDQGEAAQNFNLREADGKNQGSISGYLQANIHSLYTYVPGQYVSYSTRTPDSPGNGNIMQIGSATYPSDTFPAGSAGFQMVAVTEGILQPVVNRTFITSGANGAQGARALAETLNQQNDDTLVFLQSVGHPANNNSTWTNVLVPAMVRMGATPDVVKTLAGHGDYAMVGGAGLKERSGNGWQELPAAEVSGELLRNADNTPVPAKLQGILARDNRARYRPSQSAIGDPTVGDDPDTSLYKIAFQAPTPWPQTDTQGKKAAYIWISQQFGLVDPNDIRADYWKDLSIEWNTERDRLDCTGGPRCILYPGNGHGFDQSDFNAVRDELENEFDLVTSLKSWFGNQYGIARVFNTAQTSGQIDVQHVAHEVEQAIKPPPGGGVSFDALAFTTGIFHLLSEAIESGASFIPGEGAAYKQAAEATSGLIGALGTAVDISSTIDSDAEGVPPKDKIEAKEKELAQMVNERFLGIQDELTQIMDILVSDYGKLTAAEHLAHTKWAISLNVQRTWVDALRVELKQEFYSAMTPLVFKVYTLHEGYSGNNRNALPQNYVCPRYGSPFSREYPFAGVGASSVLYRIDGWDGNSPIFRSSVMSTELDTLPSNNYGEAGLTIQNHNRVPPPSFTDPMFRPLSEGGDVGLNPASFYDDSDFEHLNLTCAF